MAIELSNIIFTDQSDIVPLSGVEEIVNNGIVNTFAGNDVITGTGTYGFSNWGTLDTDDGNDIITGTGTTKGILNNGIINTGNGNDSIIVDIADTDPFLGALQNSNVIETGDGNDIITSTGIIYNNDIINTGNGNDFIIVDMADTNPLRWDLENLGVIETGDGNDIITSTGIIYNDYQGIINTGNNEDSIISQGKLNNHGGVFLGGGNDSIIVAFSDTNSLDVAIANSNVIETGDGKDIITTIEPIYNPLGVINTGNGDDSIIVDGTRNGYAIYNWGGNINTGEGNDSIIAYTDVFNVTLLNVSMIETGEGNDIITSKGVIYNEGTINTGEGEDFIIADRGFQSGSSGIVFLGEDEDYIKGFGSGDFNGGNGNDILELTSGSYTIGILSVGWSFAKDGIIMNTVGFEKLIAGSTSYDFTSLTEGQTIIVA